FSRYDDAVAQQARAIDEGQQRRTAVVDPACTFDEYAADWLPRHAAFRELKRRTVESYQETLRLHGSPVIGTVKVRKLSRQNVSAVLSRLTAKKAARDSLRIVLATVSAVCAGAVEDGLLAANPAAGFRKKLRPDSKRDRAEKIQALTQQQLDWLLITARER